MLDDDATSLASAKQQAADWAAQKEDFDYGASLEARFRHCGPDDVIVMWETGTNEHGKRLTRFERQALVERWVCLFNSWPPSTDTSHATPPHPHDDPADDTMLRIEEVMRLTGISQSQLRRMWMEEPPRFPRPVKLSERMIGWKASDVKAWREERDHVPLRRKRVS